MPDRDPVAPEAAPSAPPAGAPTITIPMRHAVRTVIDGASITVVPDGDPAPSPDPAAPAAADDGAPHQTPTPSEQE